MGGGGTECAETSDGEATLGQGTGWSPGHKALKNSRPPRLPKDFLRAKRWGWGRISGKQDAMHVPYNLSHTHT